MSLTQVTKDVLHNDQSNITIVGTLNSLTVSGNATVGNLSATNLTGTLATASQTNITAVGTLGSLTVTGNISAGNVSAADFTYANGVSILSDLFANAGAQAGAISSIQTNYANLAGATFTGTVTIPTLTLTNPLAVNQGGTGATSSGAALDNLLPSGEQTGYVLATSGAGSYYWASPSGGGSATVGQQLTTTRQANTATAGQSLFTLVGGRSYTPGTGQLRVYINGVRQYPSEYTETSNVSYTVTGGVSVGDLVLAEIDQFSTFNNYANLTYASNVGNITVSGLTVQTAIENLENNKAPLTAPVFTGNVTAGNVSATNLTGTIRTASQTNITAVGNLSSVATSGTISAIGQVRANSGIASSSTTTGALTVIGGVGVTGNINAGNVIATNLVGAITSSQVTTALGYTPYNGSTNPNGYLTTAVTSLAGTTNQITASAATGSVTLSLPQSINTGASVQFGSFGVGTAASGTTGEIRATNNITAYYSSDARFKENVRDIPNALDKVSAIGGKLFDWTDEYIETHGGLDGYFLTKESFGVVAQDVKQVFPEAVRTRDDGYLAVDYERMCALAFQAIKELQQQVQELQAQLKDK